MLYSRLLRLQEANLHFEVMAYLIRNFGSPPRPPVPSPLHKSPGLEKLSWTDLDTRSVYDWAKDNFGSIKSISYMEENPLSLMPTGDGLDTDIMAAENRIRSLASGRMPYCRPGHTPIYYDPRDCSEPGHFAATTILQLAEQRVVGFTTNPHLSPLMQRMTTLTAAVYNRQGFVLAKLPHRVSSYLTSEHDLRAVPHRLVENNLCFAICLALRIRHQSEEQIIATYGVRMQKSFRKKIRQACRQIQANREVLEVLQMLASPKAQQKSGALRQKRLA